MAGTLAGHAAEGSLAGLAGFLVTLAAPVGGPYRLRAGSLATTVVLVLAGATAGDVMHRHAWVAVAVVPLVMAGQSLVPSLGLTLGTSILLFALRPGYEVRAEIGLAAAGAVWASLLFLLPWPARSLTDLLTPEELHRCRSCACAGCASGSAARSACLFPQT